MKILKLLNKKNLSIIIIFLLSIVPSFSEDQPIDIWNIEKKKIENISEKKILTNKPIIPDFFSIQLSISKKSNLSLFDISLPIVDLPVPIMPKKTIFPSDFILLFIEKTQICLNLKLFKVICNLKKTQVQVRII